MAEHLASIFGTEKDRVNCPFYFKIGACRHGDRCSRLHNRPQISQTILLHGFYDPACIAQVFTVTGKEDGKNLTREEEQYQFEEFYLDLFTELSQFGTIENLNVCDNLADHLVGNIYVKFTEEDGAARALAAFTGRYYAAKPIVVEFSPVTDFREATCRQYEENTCQRGGYCNFMHLRPVGRALRKQLFGKQQKQEPPPFDDRNRGRDRDRDRDRDRGDTRRRRFSRSPPRRERRERRDASPIRESSAERRAKIAQWNAERKKQ